MTLFRRVTALALLGATLLLTATQAWARPVALQATPTRTPAPSATRASATPRASSTAQSTTSATASPAASASATPSAPASATLAPSATSTHTPAPPFPGDLNLSMVGGLLGLALLGAGAVLLVAGFSIWWMRRARARPPPPAGGERDRVEAPAAERRRAAPLAPRRPSTTTPAPSPATSPATPPVAPPAPAPVTAPTRPPSAAPATGGPYVEFEGIQGGPRRFYVGAGPLSIGRAADCEVCISETFPGWDSVSRRHARIVREVRNGQARVVVEDIGARNGVFVNGRRTGRNVLRDGWRVSLGRLTFTYRSNETGTAHELGTPS